jgi:hypothetical protein
VRARGGSRRWWPRRLGVTVRRALGWAMRDPGGCNGSLKRCSRTRWPRGRAWQCLARRRPWRARWSGGAGTRRKAGTLNRGGSIGGDGGVTMAKMPPWYGGASIGARTAGAGRIGGPPSAQRARTARRRGRHMINIRRIGGADAQRRCGLGLRWPRATHGRGCRGGSGARARRRGATSRRRAWLAQICFALNMNNSKVLNKSVPNDQ